jgi:hypothetical protein
MEKMKMKNPNRIKVMLLVLTVFILGGAIAVTQYAYGSQVIEKNENMYMISHTEYRYGEMGQIIVRLVDFQGDPIVVDNCTASILYPDKSFFAQDALMLDSENITGDHYYNFTTPNGPEGVYEYQATCNYAPSKTKTATNSFHLSSAFNTTIADLEIAIADLTEINSTVVAFRTEVQANFSQVQSVLSIINGTAEEIQYTVEQANATINGINSNLNDFITNTTLALATIDANTVAINNTVNAIYADLATLNTTMIVRFDAIDAYMSANFTQVFSNISDLRQLVYDINTSIIDAANAINLSLSGYIADLSAQLDAVNLSLSTQISDLSTKVDNVNLSISSSIADFRQEVQVNFSQAWVWFDLINTTTISTYDYMTGTLADNIDSVLTTIGVINATVNRIEEKTDVINTTTKQILQNQEDEVFISTYSG